MIRAYNEVYLNDAKRNLGQMFDYIINDYGMRPDTAAKHFVISGYAAMFENGNPSVVAGMSGPELGMAVLNKVHRNPDLPVPFQLILKTPEYWAGWALAYYQWFTGYSFMEILTAVPLEQIMAMHPTYHEMDVSQFVEQMDRHMQEAYPQTKLRMRRETCGFSQSELSADADVPLRQIQLFEQRQRDINKCAAITLLKLSRSLHCSIEDLMER